MTGMLQEVQAASYLGFTQMSDFKSALRAGRAPGHTMTQRMGGREVKLWSPKDLDEFMNGNADQAARFQESADIVNQF